MNAANLEKLQKILDDSVLSLIGLVVAFFLLAAVIHWIRSWFRDGADPTDAKGEILSRMDELRREGDLTDEEFRSIKGQITGRRDA